MTNIIWTNERRKLKDLKPWERNPRQITKEQARRLAESFDEFGQVETIAISPTDDVYNGHQRLAVLMEKHGGDYEVEVRISSRALTEKEREKLTVYLNKGAAGEWNFDALANGFEVDELIEWGFRPEELGLDKDYGIEKPEDAGAQIDKAEELREKWDVKTGQLWRLGEHRIICGDCTDRAVVERVIGTEKYSVLTDPPYNIGFNYESIDDKMSQDKYAEFCNLWFENIVSDAIGTIFSPGPHNERFYPIPRDRGFWLKRNATAGASCFHLRLVEPLLFYGKFVSKRTNDLFEYSSGFTAELKSARVAAGVVDNYAPAKSMPLWEELIGMLEKDTLVLDVFSGNGTTIIACERLGRKCRAIEISPAYVAVAIQRWVDTTGGRPELLEQ